MPRQYDDIVWSTAAAKPDARVLAWTDILSDRLFELGIETPCEDDFEASWTRYDMGSVDFNRLSALPQSVIYSHDMLVRAGGAAFLILHFQRENAIVTQGGITFEAPEGSVAMVDNTRPFTLDFPRGSVCLTLRAEEGWLRRWLPDPHAAMGLAIGGERAWTRPLIACLAAMSEDGFAGAAFARETVADQLGALVASGLAVSPSLDVGPHRRELYRRIRHTLDEICVRRGLTVADIAAEVGLSERYLHRIFASHGETVGGALIGARLQRAQAMLRSPRFAGYPISEIAWQCGFQDRRHFTRRYRHRFGEAPSKLRMH